MCMTKEDVYKNFVNDVYRYSYFLLRNKEQAEDVTSEVFMSFFEKKTLETVQSPKQYLISMTRNIIFDKFKETKTQSLDELESNFVQIQADGQVDKTVIDEELLNLIKRKIDTLDDQTREVIILKVWEELQFNEIADVVKESESTVKLRYYRGIEKLKIKLGEKKPGKKLYSLSLPLIIAAVGELALTNEFTLSKSLLVGIAAKLGLSTNLFITKALMDITSSVAVTPVVTASKGILATSGAKLAAMVGLGTIVIVGTTVGVVAIANNKSNVPTSYPTGITNTSQINILPIVQLVSSPTQASDLTQQYDGTYLKAMLPTNWSAKEYTDTSGDPLIPSGSGISMTGLTGLDIIDNNSTVIYKLRVSDGRGGGGPCLQIAQFKDTDPTYIQQAQKLAQNNGATTNILDFTNQQYESVNLFGLSLRRVGDTYYQNVSTDSYFNPACSPGFGGSRTLTFKSISYASDNGPNTQFVSGNTYVVSMSNDLPEATLMQLDEVFNNITPKLTKEYTGTYLKAILPNDWSIKEITDATGDPLVPSGSDVTMTGLTGLAILDSNSNPLFNLWVADGIGGSGGCSEVVQFNDTDPNYIDQLKSSNNSGDALKIDDYTRQRFSYINLLNLSLRRVGNVYYINTSSNNNSFNAACGGGARTMNFQSIGYTYSTSPTTVDHLYLWSITNNLSETTLVQLDQVLNSISAK